MLTISVGQALLLLIDKYRNSPSIVDELKKLYLIGAVTSDDKARIVQLMEDDALMKYIVSYEPNIINDDPARRYFETHLAFKVLKDSLQFLEYQSLVAQYRSVYNLIPGLIKCKHPHIKKVLEGNYTLNDTNTLIISNFLFGLGYAQAIKNLKSNTFFNEFIENEKEKLIKLISISYLSIICCDSSTGINPPIDIYQKTGKGIFSYYSRGKYTSKNLTLDDCNKLSTQHLGLLKSNMPVPKNDLAFADQPYTYPKSADTSVFDPSGKWVIRNFDLWVQPFSHAISGSVLGNLRIIKKLENENKNNINLFYYMQCLISFLLYNSGGHSLYEFTAPMTLPEVINAFPGIDKHINLLSLFYNNNQREFSEALEETILYNYSILKKAALNEEIITTKRMQPEINSSIKNLTNSLLTKYQDQVKLQDQLENYIKQKVKEINNLCKENNIGLLTQFKIKEIFLLHLSEVDFSSITDVENFQKFLENQNLDFINTEKYIKKILNVESVILQITAIRDKINEAYNQENKGAIALFNKNLDQLIFHISSKYYNLNVVEIKSNLNKFLDSLKNKEIGGFMSFFIRSHLLKNIEIAKSIANDLSYPADDIVLKKKKLWFTQ